jgi:predicted enzyme related to lactoylglutathione lyase
MPITNAPTPQRLGLLLALGLLPTAAFAAPPPASILYVGSVSINPSQEAKVLAAWYARLGVETKEMGGGYYCQIDTAAGPFFFGIHRKKKDAPHKSSASVSIVFRVENFETRIATLTAEGLAPESTEKDSTGQFAHFRDPDGNQVTLWGK